MSEQFLEQIKSNPMLSTLVVMLGVNILLSAFAKSLAKVKDKTKTKLDNKLWAFIRKLALVSSGIVDVLSANVEHKKDEIK